MSSKCMFHDWRDPKKEEYYRDKATPNIVLDQLWSGISHKELEGRLSTMRIKDKSDCYRIVRDLRIISESTEKNCTAFFWFGGIVFDPQRGEFVETTILYSIGYLTEAKYYDPHYYICIGKGWLTPDSQTEPDIITQTISAKSAENAANDLWNNRGIINNHCSVCVDAMGKTIELNMLCFEVRYHAKILQVIRSGGKWDAMPDIILREKNKKFFVLSKMTQA